MLEAGQVMKLAILHRLQIRILAFLTASALPCLAWQPGTGNPNAADGFSVNAADRRDVLAFYHCVYQASEGYRTRINWTGSVANCVPGTTAAAFKEDVRRRVNFYRALSGLPADITFNAVKSAKCQEAALMFSANNAISHNPPAAWLCYTANGAEGASTSNIAYGTHGPGSVDAYMRDNGDSNTAVGHRRWLMYSRAQEMGTGDVPPNGTKRETNAIWVIGNPKPAPAPSFIAWPPAGYVPHTLVPSRWSLSYPGAGFGSATVTMSQGQTSIPVTIISRSVANTGENTIVWEPAGIPASVTTDVPYTVTVAGISGGGPATKSYTVTLFNPDILGESVTISGTSTPPVSGQSYPFSTISQADAYEVEVSTGSTAAWTEGAEDIPTPQVASGISPGYSLWQSSLRRTGSRAFQLTFPSGVFSDQSFTITRSILPAMGSQLRFYDRARWTVTTSTLEVQVSTDNGTAWTTINSRNGVGLSSANWDAAWISRSISLDAWAGQVILIRFVLKSNGGSVTQGVTSEFGFFIDDVTVTGASELLGRTTTPLPGSASSFTLNTTTAGAPLVAGTSYYLRIRPSVGCRWFGFGPHKTVTAQALSGYDAWIAASFPAVTGGFTADHDKDGIANGVEYALNLNPTQPNAASLPQPTMNAGMLTLAYTTPQVPGVSHSAEWSPNLQSWFPITDTGAGNNHQFAVSTATSGRVFLRLKITKIP